MVAVATYGIRCAIAIAGRSLPWPNRLPGSGADGRCGGRARGRRRRTGALYAGVHVRLVVVADVQHVVVAFEHARQAAQSDVDGAAVAALADHADVVAPLRPQRRGDPRGDRGSVAEQRVQPGHLPRCLRVRGREHLQATGGVDHHRLAVGGPHAPRRARIARPVPRRSPGRHGAPTPTRSPGPGRPVPSGVPDRATGYRRPGCPTW